MDLHMDLKYNDKGLKVSFKTILTQYICRVHSKHQPVVNICISLASAKDSQTSQEALKIHLKI